MIASWPQAALRGSSSVASAGPPSCICLIGNSRVRSVTRLSSPQRTEASRMKEASTELQPSTLPETWERSSLSDDGIREALRARSKHYAALDEIDQADSATMSPEREQEQDDAQISKEQTKRRKQRMAKPSVSPPAPNSSEGTAAKDDGLSERQRRRKRVGWALQQRNGGKTMKGSKEKQPAAMFTRELEVLLCSQIQEAQRLRQVYEDACSRGEQLSEQQWAQAGGLSSVGKLQKALQAGTAAQKRLLKEHKGFLISLVNKHTRQGLSHEELMIEASSAFIKAAERFDVSKNARLPSYGWFAVMAALQQLCQDEGALLPMTTSASRHLVRLSQAESQLRQKTGEDPTLAEIAAQAGITTERAQLLRNRQNAIAYESINTTFKGGVTRGADDLVGTDKEQADLQDPALSIDEREKALHMRAVVNLALDALACKDGAPGGYPKRNQLMAAAMRLRYGLDDNKPRTLKEVSAALRAEHNSKGPSIEMVRVLVEDGKERLALILAQEGLLKELQLSA